MADAKPASESEDEPRGHGKINDEETVLHTRSAVLPAVASAPPGPDAHTSGEPR
jgi:hypothetical protein